MPLSQIEGNLKNKKNIGFIHKILASLICKNRNRTASTKTRSEVRGGGKKPWKQKGTGNARAGSIRSPIWVGGGVSFGPQPHKKSCKINKKEIKLGHKISLELKNDAIFHVRDTLLEQQDGLPFKKIRETFGPMLSPNKKILIIVKNISNNMLLALKNIKKCRIMQENQLNLREILAAEIIILSNKIELNRYEN